MASGIYAALSGAVAQADALDVTANNVANASTVGYRAERMSFAETLGRVKGAPAMVHLARTAADPSKGELSRTDEPLDLALQGEGMFALQSPRGVRYTRAGNFRLDAQRRVVGVEDLPVRARGGGILQVPAGASDLAVQPDGTLTADGVTVGAFELQKIDPAQLAREGKSLYVLKPGAPQPAALLPGQKGPEVVSGALEQANFDVVRGMVDLIRVSRTYESLHRMIESYKEIDTRTVQKNT